MHKCLPNFFWSILKQMAHLSQAIDLSVFLLILKLKYGTPASYVPVVLQSFYQSKFSKKYCRRNFITIDVT